MWKEWLARTLHPRPGEAVALRADAAMAAGADDQHGEAAARPATPERVRAAPHEDRGRVAADLL
jgi:hypothetical protein